MALGAKESEREGEGKSAAEKDRESNCGSGDRGGRYCAWDERRAEKWGGARGRIEEAQGR